MVQAIAVQDRVNVEHLPDEPRHFTIETAQPSLWLLSKAEFEKLQNMITELIKRIICNQMAYFKKEYGRLVKNRIEHKFTKEMDKRSNIVSSQEISCYLLIAIISTKNGKKSSIFMSFIYSNRYH